MRAVFDPFIDNPWIIVSFWKLYSRTSTDPSPVLFSIPIWTRKNVWQRQISKARTNPTSSFSNIKNIILSIFSVFNRLFNSFQQMLLLNGHKHQIKHGAKTFQQKSGQKLERQMNVN